MANNYVAFSEFYPFPEEHRAWIERSITNDPVGDLEEEWNGEPDHIAAPWRDKEFGGRLDFQATINDDNLRVFAEESGDPYLAAQLFHHILARIGDPTLAWKLGYACWCSKLRVGEFGGGIFVASMHCVEHTEREDVLKSRVLRKPVTREEIIQHETSTSALVLGENVLVQDTRKSPGDVTFTGVAVGTEMTLHALRSVGIDVPEYAMKIVLEELMRRADSGYMEGR